MNTSIVMKLPIQTRLQSSSFHWTIQHLYRLTQQPFLNVPFFSVTTVSTLGLAPVISHIAHSTDTSGLLHLVPSPKLYTNTCHFSNYYFDQDTFPWGSDIMLHQEAGISGILAVFYFSTVLQPHPKNQDVIIEHYRIQLFFPKLIISGLFLLKINGSSNYCLP